MSAWDLCQWRGFQQTKMHVAHIERMLTGADETLLPITVVAFDEFTFGHKREAVSQSNGAEDCRKHVLSHDRNRVSFSQPSRCRKCIYAILSHGLIAKTVCIKHASWRGEVGLHTENRLNIWRSAFESSWFEQIACRRSRWSARSRYPTMTYIGGKENQSQHGIAKSSMRARGGVRERQPVSWNASSANPVASRPVRLTGLTPPT